MIYQKCDSDYQTTKLPAAALAASKQGLDLTDDLGSQCSLVGAEWSLTKDTLLRCHCYG